MVDPVVLDGPPIDELKGLEYNPECSEKNNKQSLKRKRPMVCNNYSREEKESIISGFHQEINGLLRYFNAILAQKVHLGDAKFFSNSSIACLIEESRLPFSKLVADIYEKLKSNDRVTLTSVQCSVLSIGQRSMYGIGHADTDVLEDESEACLWCWESRDMKLLPKSQRGTFNIRRICRKKIHERIAALSAMLSVLSYPENHPSFKFDLKKASEKLGKALNEAQIQALIESLQQKNDIEMAVRGEKLQEKDLLKELKNDNREIEKETKRMEEELPREKSQTERQLKCFQEEAEEEEKRHKKEQAELRKQLKRQQEEAEKDQRRREKEEADFKKQIAIQKQASIMQRFLRSNKKNADDQDMQLAGKASELVSYLKFEERANPLTILMDNALSQSDAIDTGDLFRSHLSTWHKFTRSNRRKKSHWGVRQKPKVALFTQLKLQGSSVVDEPSIKPSPKSSSDFVDVKNVNDEYSQKLVGACEETFLPDRLCQGSDDTCIRLYNRLVKLLQFDKSPRPPYYGTWSTKSAVVGPRSPFKRDPNLDYDICSDEEWEEDEPGERLSDCDKDDEEDMEDGDVHVEYGDVDESEDSFMVPDGYLSENEGVQVDSEAHDFSIDEVSSSSVCVADDIESEEFSAFRRQQKCLHEMTERALQRNEPLIISNLMHEKAALMVIDDHSGSLEVELMCLQALRMRSCYGDSCVEISLYSVLTEDEEFCQSHKEIETEVPSPVPVTMAQNLDLHELVSVIQSCPYGINKVVESLLKRFPTIPKAQLRSKVREVSNFADNHWQVKKEILENLGLVTSPAQNVARTRGISAFFSKRCLSPSESREASQPFLEPVIIIDEEQQKCVDNRPDFSILLEGDGH